MNEAIDKFFSSEAYAVVGVSRNAKKFGNSVFSAMKNRNLTVYPVSTHLSMVEDEHCYAHVRDLPNEVKSVVIVVHPENAAQVVAECKWKGIENIWLQQGAESKEAIAYAQEYGLNLIHGQCVLMFLEPVQSLHALHRWAKKLVGSYPE